MVSGQAIRLPAYSRLPSGERSGKQGQPAAAVCFYHSHTVTSHKPKAFEHCPQEVLLDDRTNALKRQWLRARALWSHTNLGSHSKSSQYRPCPCVVHGLQYSIGLWGALNDRTHVNAWHVASAQEEMCIVDHGCHLLSPVANLKQLMTLKRLLSRTRKSIGLRFKRLESYVKF